eukprot:11585274-Ditylum_brightwellii.AAC.1
MHQITLGRHILHSAQIWVYNLLQSPVGQSGSAQHQHCHKRKQLTDILDLPQRTSSTRQAIFGKS